MAIKAKRKPWNPLKQPPLRNPGESLNEELTESLAVDVYAWMLAPVLLGAVALIEWWRWSRGMQPNPQFYAILAGVFGVFGVVKLRKGLRKVRRLRQGILGEVAVGQMLEALRPQGYAVFHDVPERGYNIDHVLVGPAGVIVVETKTPSKPVGRESTIEYDGRRVLIDGIAPDRVPIKQVKACADRIREILLAGTNLRPFVRPVVLYPDWWVEPMPKGVEVWVLNQRVLADFLRHEPTHLKPDDVRLLAAALETHIRVSLNAGGI